MRISHVTTVQINIQNKSITSESSLVPRLSLPPSPSDKKHYGFCHHRFRGHGAFFLLQWVFVALRRLSLVTESRGYSLLWGTASVGPWCQQLQLIGLVSLWHVKSSQTKDRTLVPCIGRHIIIHWTTREVQLLDFLKVVSSTTLFIVFIF